MRSLVLKRSEKFSTKKQDNTRKKRNEMSSARKSPRNTQKKEAKPEETPTKPKPPKKKQKPSPSPQNQKQKKPPENQKPKPPEEECEAELLIRDLPALPHPQEDAVIRVEEQFPIDEKYVNPAVVVKKKRRLEQAPDVFSFELADVGLDYTFGFFGKRREGKSFTMRWLMYHMRTEFPRVYVFTNTSFNGFWQRMVPEGKVFPTYMPGVLQAIISQQEQFLKDQENVPEQDRANPRVMIILDDCISQKLQNDEVLRTLFYNGRHLKFCLMISLQYCRGLPPGMRTNFDMAFAFRLQSIEQREAFAEAFLGHLDKRVGQETLETYSWQDHETKQRQVLVVDISGNKPIDEMLSACQPQEVPEFRVGCKEFWDDEPPPAPPKQNTVERLSKKRKN